MEIHHLDARNYIADALRRAARRRSPFDFIICDSVRLPVPYQLTTREFLQQVRQPSNPTATS